MAAHRLLIAFVLGKGTRLFGAGTPAGAFRLVEQRTSAGGQVRPCGPRSEAAGTALRSTR